MRFELRRRWSRLAFCLLCVAPTLAVAGAVVVTHNPFYAAARRAVWESQWSARLGLTVTADALQQHDGAWVIRGLELRDPETDHWLLKAASLEIADADQGYVILRIGRRCVGRSGGGCLPSCMNTFCRDLGWPIVP